MIASTFCIVIYSRTLYIISLGFLNLCFVISKLSPKLVLISELSVFVSSSLPVSISILLSLIVSAALITILMSVVLIFFRWILMCSGERASSFGVSVILKLWFSPFLQLPRRVFFFLPQMVAQLHSTSWRLLHVVQRWRNFSK